MEEQLRILKMLEEGKVTAEQAANLLKVINKNALKDQEAQSEPKTSSFKVRPEFTANHSSYDKKMFHIQITAIGINAVNLQFPVIGIKKMLKATGKIPFLCEDINGMSLKDLTGLDLKETLDTIIECLDSETMGDFINISSGEGNSVKIFVR